VAERLIFATSNLAKLGQLRYVVAQYGFDFTVASAEDLFGSAGNYAEVGHSADQIAAHGAAVVARRVDQPVMAEDTVFEVEALGGQPGVTAGAYLRTHGRRGILVAMEGQDNRQARIVSAVAYAEPGRAPTVWNRTVPGRIAHSERWATGLPAWVSPSRADPLGGGYNAIFVPAGESRTLAEIPLAEGLTWGYRERLFYACLVYLTRRARRLGD
jgi:XTP/dITP diphosphohydrolase